MSEPPQSAYLSLRQAVRPAIFAHSLLAGEAERAGKLAAECDDLLLLTRELLKVTGQERLLDAGAAESAAGSAGGAAGGEEQREPLLEAYAESGMLWAKIVGSSLALGAALLERGDWDETRLLAAFLADAGEKRAAADLRMQLGRAVWDAHRGQLATISNTMPPAAIGEAIGALRAVLREAPDDFPGLNREVNRLLVPLAASVLVQLRRRDIELPFTSRVEHIATGGVAKYPELVTMSLDEIAAEFEGLIR
jgi:hypothetical protein